MTLLMAQQALAPGLSREPQPRAAYLAVRMTRNLVEDPSRIWSAFWMATRRPGSTRIGFLPYAGDPPGTTQVPLVEPRSSRSHCPSTSRTRVSARYVRPHVGYRVAIAGD